MVLDLRAELMFFLRDGARHRHHGQPSAPRWWPIRSRPTAPTTRTCSAAGTTWPTPTRRPADCRWRSRCTSATRTTSPGCSGPAHPDTLDQPAQPRQHLPAGRAHWTRRSSCTSATWRTSCAPVAPSIRAPWHSRHNLGIAYHAAGRIDADAIRRLEENLRVRERVLGAAHPDIMGSRHELALAYQEAGRADRAAGLHERNLQDRQRALGADHPDTLRSRHGLALAHLALRRPDRGHPAARADRRRRRPAAGRRPSRTRSGARNNAGQRLSATPGARPTSIALHERNLDDQRRLHGPEHPGVLVTCANLAERLRERRPGGRRRPALPADARRAGPARPGQPARGGRGCAVRLEREQLSRASGQDSFLFIQAPEPESPGPVTGNRQTMLPSHERTGAHKWGVRGRRGRNGAVV